MPAETPAPTAAGLLAAADWKGHLSLTAAERDRLARGHARFAELVTAGNPVYGVHRGFGPLAAYPAEPDPARRAAGLVDHLTAGQGAPLPPGVTRLMVWLRLRNMALGHSGVPPAIWAALADQWNAGVTPVVPEDGSLSASGDLVPLAHAARAAAGDGEVA